MKIDTQHIDEPGLVVLDITAANEETAHAVMAELKQRWVASFTSGGSGSTFVVAEPGVSVVRGVCPVSSGRSLPPR
ncbi:DUF6207 family protein [Streptomyces sp. NPDC057543]|uniref:DUF6207 family protein n=1 Tax=Streptomyces sp. NPDC057543 TaxID=3346163 RepID=UPI0036A56340